MNAGEAQKYLEEKAVPPQYYTFGGLSSGECIGIEEEKGAWIVYFSERGARQNVRTFTSENEAVAYFIDRVLQLYAEYTNGKTP